MANEIYKIDLYAILGVSEDASEKDILRGYRKRALKCHPDKNPDNPKAAELFHELSNALEILTDVAARAAYDQSRKAKKAAEERHKVLDVKRKKFKEDLEAREKASFESNLKEKTEAAERKLQKEIERLRREGSKLLAQEQERMRQELKHPTFEDDNDIAEYPHESEIPRIKLKWKAQKCDSKNGGYSTDFLKNIFGCYGQINTLIVSSKRNGSAIIEFENSGVTCDILDESGLKENPLSIVWLSGKPLNHKVPSSFSPQEGYTNSGCGTTPHGFNDANFADSNYMKSDVNIVAGDMFQLDGKCASENSFVNDRNYESLVLMKMRQAEERKRLIEQLKKEDEDDG